MIQSWKFALPLALLASPLQAQEPPRDPVAAEEPAEPEKEGPITRQTANRESPLLDFEYSWPQAIAGDAKLVEQLSSDLSKNYDEALKNARENKLLVEQNNGTFHQNLFTRVWSLEGETPRFFSLVAHTDTFAGGAHPNQDSTALLWDRSAQQQVEFTDLFAAANGLESVVRTQYCKLLDAERAKRREGETLDGPFAECPPFSELTIYPAGKDGKGPFTSIYLIADPYVAGPYVEGDYEVQVPVTAALVNALKPEYRENFEAQRAQ